MARLRLLWVGGAFVGLVGGAAAVAYPALQLSRVDWTRMNIRDVESALERYARNTGHFPSETEGLGPLVATGALAAEPHDAWGRRYHYALLQGRPVITSFGSDGQPGGQGPNADISNLSPEHPR
jgi:general secretion pathway protein G